jgi:hypothetical protein
MVDIDEAVQTATLFLARRLTELSDQRELPSVQDVTTGQVATPAGESPCHMVSFGWPLRVAVDQETGNADMQR